MQGTHDPLSEKIDESSIGNNETGEDSDDTQFKRGNHPNSRANLQPFPKGVSGNPLGKPHKYHKLAESLIKLASNPVIKKEWNGMKYVEVETGNNWREEVLETVWRKARIGDIKFIQLLAYLGCLDD